MGIAWKICSIIVEIYFTHISKKFAKVLRLQPKDQTMYFDIEESAERDFEQVPSTPSHEARRNNTFVSSLNLGITSNNASELESQQTEAQRYAYVPPVISDTTPS